jgi:hypothetical protein
MDTEIAMLFNEIDTDWRDQALCSGMTEVFFGPAAERPERRVEREALAKSFCRVCPAALPCRRAGRLNHEHGIWGGENDEERAAAGYAPRSPSRRSVIQARDSHRQVDTAPDIETIDHEVDLSLEELMSESPGAFWV